MEEADLLDLNNQLTEKRAAAIEEIKADQLAVNEELSRRQLRRRLEGMSQEERAELVAMIKEDADNG
jgi:hypothetical protein